MLRRREGFTLIEAMIVVAIIGVIATFATPFLGNVLENNKLDSAVRNVVASLRQAQVLAQAGSGGSSWGVNISSASVVIFQGSSFAGRDASFDQGAAMPDEFLATGITEFVFTSREGVTTSGTLVLADEQGIERSVTVNTYGMIEY